jgi:hypothetical protein
MGARTMILRKLRPEARSGGWMVLDNRRADVSCMRWIGRSGRRRVANPEECGLKNAPAAFG